jgi:hypothetical protein
VVVLTVIFGSDANPVRVGLANWIDWDGGEGDPPPPDPHGNPFPLTTPPDTPRQPVRPPSRLFEAFCGEYTSRFHDTGMVPLGEMVKSGPEIGPPTERVEVVGLKVRLADAPNTPL